MSKRLSSLLPLVAIIAGCNLTRQEETPPPPPPPSATPVPAVELGVIDQRKAALTGTQILSLSPNGKWLLAARKGELCTYEIESLTEQTCIELNPDLVSIDSSSISWSPDSTRIAFTEWYQDESDLWIMDVESGNLVDLTDDRLTGSIFDIATEMGSSTVNFDLVPAWSPDGTRLVFSRSTVSDGKRETSLYAISARGGDVERLIVATDGSWDIRHPPHWTADGQRILYTVERSLERNNPDNGVWVMEQDGQNPQQLIGITDPRMGYPVLIDVSSQGNKALILYYEIALSLTSEPNASYYAILDLQSGNAEPLKKATSEVYEFTTPTQARFSPDGTKILYVYHAKSGEAQLAIRDVHGTEENILQTHLAIGASSPNRAEGFFLALDWAEDNTIYFATAIHSGFLLSLETE